MSSSLVAAPDLKVRKMLGRTCLDERRIEEAVLLFNAILQDYPDDVDSLVALGDLYLSGGDGNSARRLYERALWLDPRNPALRKQIELAWSKSWEATSEPLPTDPAEVGRLLQRLTGRSDRISEQELNHAAVVLMGILQAENPAKEIAERLDEIDEILPALLEINIRQARADGNVEIEAGLRSLQANLIAQMEGDQNGEYEADKPIHPFTGRGWQVLLLNGRSFGRSNRVELLKSALLQGGCTVNTSLAACLEQGDQPDVIIAANPHLQPEALEGIARLTSRGAPLIVDLETDFELLPVHDPLYAGFGLGTPARGKAYAAALLMADRITVPSPLHAESLRSAGRPAEFIPDGWSRTNFIWLHESPPRDTINLGWVANPSQSQDLASIRRAVVRVMREFQQTHLVVIGDFEAYRMFDIVPENRRMYLPLTGAEEYPFLLDQVDILLVPLRNHPYNDSISDTMLIEAGIKGIPWVSSPAAPFRRWAAGGLLAASVDEWHIQLRELVLDREQRQALGMLGRRMALTREMNEMAFLWLRAIQSVARDTGRGEKLSE
ncbi:MAG: tetratricopeptide repeat protein [Chloroflexota bacterium]